MMTKERFKWILYNVDFDKLTDWEEEFLQSCSDQLKKKEELSDKQEAILERIHKERQ